MEEKKEVEKCEWGGCKEDAKWTVSTGDGRFVRICTVHRRALMRQRKANGRI